MSHKYMITKFGISLKVHDNDYENDDDDDDAHENNNNVYSNPKLTTACIEKVVNCYQLHV